MIDAGFAGKLANQPEAAICSFVAALKLSEEPELKYILILESVILYKNLGRYEEAEELLNIYIGNANLRPDIIDKINIQLSYIRILRSELIRLGHIKYSYREGSAMGADECE